MTTKTFRGERWGGVIQASFYDSIIQKQKKLKQLSKNWLLRPT